MFLEGNGTTYTVDFLIKKRVTNNGVVPQYYVENDHEVIIPKEMSSTHLSNEVLKISEIYKVF